jgi:hypothetical protein
MHLDAGTYADGSFYDNYSADGGGSNSYQVHAEGGATGLGYRVDQGNSGHFTFHGDGGDTGNGASSTSHGQFRVETGSLASYALHLDGSTQFGAYGFDASGSDGRESTVTDALSTGGTTHSDHVSMTTGGQTTSLISEDATTSTSGPGAGAGIGLSGLFGVLMPLMIDPASPDSVSQSIDDAILTGDPSKVINALGLLEQAGAATPETIAATENAIARLTTKQLLAQAPHNGIAAASRKILPKLLNDFSGKFARVSKHELGVRANGDKILEQLFKAISPNGQKLSAQQMVRQNLKGLKNLTLRVPKGITRDSLEAYHEAARRAIAGGIDSAGSQEARIELIEFLLNSGMVFP